MFNTCVPSDQIRFGQLLGEGEQNRNEDQRSHLAGATGKIKGEYEENNKCVFVCEKEVDGKRERESWEENMYFHCSVTKGKLKENWWIPNTSYPAHQNQMSLE